MLSRGSSDAGSRLRRAKSTSSVHGRAPVQAAEPIDPVVARKHARVAATTAYIRTHGSDDVNGLARQRPDVPRRRSRVHGTSEGEGSHFQSKRSSLRFSMDSGHLKRQASQKQDVARRNRLGSRTPSNEPPAPETSYHVTQSAETHDHRAERQHQTPIQMPMRRVRKSRSLYNASGHEESSARRHIADTKAGNNALIFKNGCDNPHNRASGLDHGETANALGVSDHHNQTDDEMVAMARDRYLQDIKKQGLRSRPSLLLAPFKKRQERASRQSTQVQPSLITYEEHPVSPVQDLPVHGNHSGTSDRRRSVSGSLRDRIMRVFRKSSNASSTLPAQQVQASRPHFGDFASSPSVVHATYEDTPSPDEDTLVRARSRTPSIRQTPSNPQLRSRGSSVALSESDANVKSRVTSWSDSTAPNTVASRTSKRLSVIDENGGSHQSSTSRYHHGSSRLISGVFRKPMRKLSQSTIGSNPPADNDQENQGRMNSTKGTIAASHAPTLLEIPGAIHDTLPSQKRISSITSAIVRRKKSTIRTVSPEEQHESSDVLPDKKRISISECQMEYLASGTAAPSHGCRYGREKSDTVAAGSSNGVPVPTASAQQRQGPNIVPPPVPTAEQIATRLARSQDRWKTPLEESNPFFSPGATKRAYAAYNPYGYYDRPATPPAGISVKHLDNQFDGLREPIPVKIEAVSPSVYSQRTDCHSPEPLGNPAMLKDLLRHEEGTAIILSSHHTGAYSLGSPEQAKTGTHSAKSSKDWRAWLSKEVAELEVSPQEEFAINSQYVAKKNGHQREHAQIMDSEDTAIGGTSAMTRPRKSSRPKLEERPSSRMNERFPMLETGRKKSDERKAGHKASPPVEDLQLINQAREASPPRDTAFLKPQAEENSSYKSLASHSHLRRPRSMQQMSAYVRSSTSVAKFSQSTSEAESLTPPSQVRTRYTGTNGVHQSRSALGLHDQYSGNNRIVRKPAGSSVLECDTVRGIVEGPYRTPTAMSAIPSPGYTNRSNKENVHTTLASRLAAFDFPDEERPKSRASNFSQASGCTPTGGQRMADRFLSARRKGEAFRFASESPVFL